MSLETVQEYLGARGLGDRVQTFDVSSATVELAAKALGCEPQRIAKTLAFRRGETMPWLEERRLSPRVHAMAIQKVVESYRISAEDKAYLRTLR